MKQKEEKQILKMHCILRNNNEKPNLIYEEDFHIA